MRLPEHQMALITSGFQWSRRSSTSPGLREGTACGRRKNLHFYVGRRQPAVLAAVAAALAVAAAVQMAVRRSRSSARRAAAARRRSTVGAWLRSEGWRASGGV